MTAAPLRRLRYPAQRAWLFLNKGPAFVGAFAAWQANRWARRVGWRPRPWETAAAFWADLDAAQPGLRAAAQAHQAGDPAEAARALQTHFARGPRPPFFFDPTQRAALRAAIPPAAQAATVAAADLAAQRTFVFRGQPPVTFAEAVDWTHRPEGNTDWMWDLNRHFFFVTLGQAFWYTGAARYPAAFAALLHDWLARNPAREDQPNWADPFEVACRITTWLWAYHLFAEALDAETHAALVGGLWRHGAYLDACLELHVPNNHLLLEAKALAMLGLALPEARAARRWRARGLALVAREAGRQIEADGMHAERAPHYHRLIASELLELVVLLTNDPWPGRAALTQTLGRMLEVERHLTRPDGHLPLFGDSAQGDPHIRFAPLAGGAAWLQRADLKTPGASLDEATTWLVGPARAAALAAMPPAPPAPSRCFPVGGVAVLRAGWGAEAGYLALDCGPFGYPPAPGHGHADALSLEVFANGQPLIVDAGVYSYHLGARWRNHFRGTRAHNTVRVDGVDQSELLDTARVWRPAQARVLAWEAAPELDFVDADHDGYLRLARPIRHRRQILYVKPEYWLVVDWLTGAGRHNFEWRYQLPPEAQVQAVSEAGAVSEALVIAIAPRPGLSVTATEAWASFRSGHKQPAPAIDLQWEAEAPVCVGAVLWPRAPGATALPRVLDRSAEVRDAAGAPVGEGVAAFEVQAEGFTDLFILDIRPVRGRKCLGPLDTTAAAAQARVLTGHAAPARAWASAAA